MPSNKKIVTKEFEIKGMHITNEEKFKRNLRNIFKEFGDKRLRIKKINVINERKYEIVFIIKNEK